MSSAPTPLRFRLTKSDRLLRRSEFLRVQRQGSKFNTRHLLIAFATNDLNRVRLGCVVTTKIDKRSNRRNLFRRRIKEIFRCRKSSFAAPIDLVIIARQGALNCSFAELERELTNGLRKQGLFT